MTLAAAQVIDTVAARLVNATSAGSRVYTSRMWPLSEAELPAWRVTAQDEAVDADFLETHSLSIEAAGYVRAAADLDDAMHALAEAGLTALFAGTPPHQLRLQRIERSTTDIGEASAGVIRLQMLAVFSTLPDAPGTIVM